MAGHHKYSELRAKMSPERRERIDRRVEAELAAMELDELRQARGLTQEELAVRVGTGQAAVSRMEGRTDVRVSTLRGVIEALGGELVITARFPDGEPTEVRITQFDGQPTAA